jgi:hypothetical protein
MFSPVILKEWNYIYPSAGSAAYADCTKEGTDAERLVKDATLRLLEEDARFRTAVRKGIAQADRGELMPSFVPASPEECPQECGYGRLESRA